MVESDSQFEIVAILHLIDIRRNHLIAFIILHDEKLIFGISTEAEQNVLKLSFLSVIGLGGEAPGIAIRKNKIRR